MSDTTALPPGEYAIVELFGHTTVVGRIAEVERFGAKMMAIEPLFRGALLPAVFQGGASIYRLTPCSAEVAFARSPTSEWQLPAPVRSIVPPLLLSGPERGAVDVAADQESDDEEAELPADVYFANDDTNEAFPTLADAVEELGHWDVTRVLRARFLPAIWVVRVPIADGAGNLDGDELIECRTEEEAKELVASGKADAAEVEA